ncbi:MAG TPA: DUF6282 family protein [Alphaproteobacteria bacterium]|nr:DUF6282 family protein [Alphaproteobacteria bacterium]
MRQDLELMYGGVDIHVHQGPDLYERIQDHNEVARAARTAGMRAICLKCHNFPTAQMALTTAKEVSGIDVFGSIVCNLQVGGVNPNAVEAAIKYGVRQIYLPTIDSTNHQKLTGVVGQHGTGLTIKGGLSDYTLKQPRIDLLDADGTLMPEVGVILDLVGQANVIFNFGHVAFEEMEAVIAEAKKHKVKKLVVDHPFFSKLDVQQQQTLADHGVYVNYTAGELLPRWWRVSIKDFAGAIRQIGPERMVLSSDCGQLHNPPEVEGLRIVCQLLLEEGLDEAAIKRMFHTNPADLLYE